MAKTATRKRRRKWTVFFPKENRYLSDPSGRTNGIAWTYGLREITITARGMGGIVVDAKWLAEHWGDWKKTGEIPDWARPD